MQDNALRHVHGLDGWRHEFIEQDLPRLRREGATVEAIDAARDAMRPDPPTHTAHYRVFRTADGWIALGAGSPALRARLFELLGIDVDPALRRVGVAPPGSGHSGSDTSGGCRSQRRT